jgi:hypothetical protein
LQQLVQSLVTGGNAGPALATLAVAAMNMLEPGFSPVGLPAGFELLGFGPTTENVGNSQFAG